ncbi:FHA domain-containing protein [Nakamurella aerolata]|uniref:FHA domain-containing protein n=1 Tax=Nakamurella aerolata TaxID=1656892 RepID=UPI001BB12DFC|nr:FHA domain-containing protein [Nakamurella aerolata]
MLRLDVHDGPQRRTVELDTDQIRIGRDPECELVLPGDTTVSRVHAMLRLDARGWVLSDWDSRNGTFVNGKAVSEPQLVGPADRVLIGQFVLVLRSDDDELLETADAAGATERRAQLDTGLSARELEVLRLVAAGDSDQQIADALFISVKTVHSHLDRIRDKTGCRRRQQLLRFAIDNGIS